MYIQLYLFTPYAGFIWYISCALGKSVLLVVASWHRSWSWSSPETCTLTLIAVDDDDIVTSSCASEVDAPYKMFWVYLNESITSPISSYTTAASVFGESCLLASADALQNIKQAHMQFDLGLSLSILYYWLHEGNWSWWSFTIVTGHNYFTCQISIPVNHPYLGGTVPLLLPLSHRGIVPLLPHFLESTSHIS